MAVHIGIGFAELELRAAGLIPSTPPAPIAEDRRRDQRLAWIALLLAIALLLVGCSATHDYATLASAYAEEGAARAGDQLERVNDSQLRWYARLYCDAVSAGALARRYVVPGHRETREIACRMERENGW